MKVALVQFDIFWNEPERNLEHCHKLVTRCVDGGAKLIVLPEMFTTGFSLCSGDEAKKAGRAGARFLEEMAKEHSAYFAGSVPVVTDAAQGKPTNTVLVYGPEGQLGEYSKIHLFSHDEEDKSYLSGTRTLTLEIEDFRVSFFICYDLRFPQIFSKVSNETDLFVVVANWPAAREDHWRALLVARAIENQAFVAGVNRVGEGKNGVRYPGSSMFISPIGEVLRRGSDKEELLICDLDIEHVKKYREVFPTLRDRRDEIYSL